VGIKLKEIEGSAAPKVNIDDKIGGRIHELGCRTLPSVIPTLLVCVFVSVCPQEYLRNDMRDYYQILCMLPVAVARSSSGVVAIRYVLPVLWVTSCLFL